MKTKTKNGVTKECAWTWLRDDGNPRSYFKDEHSLLVSYDFFPLRGLETTKMELTKIAPIVKGHFVISQDNNLFIPYRYDNPDINAVDWGCHNKIYNNCFRNLAFYIYSNKTIDISIKDNNVLIKYHCMEYERDGKRRRPFKKLKAKTEGIIKELGYKIQSVSFVPENK